MVLKNSGHLVQYTYRVLNKSIAKTVHACGISRREQCVENADIKRRIKKDGLGI